MQPDIAQEIFEKVSSLSVEQQQDVLKIVESKLKPHPIGNDSRPIWEIITEMSSEIPDEMWDELPSDGSVNHDHYLYGAPKKVI